MYVHANSVVKIIRSLSPRPYTPACIIGLPRSGTTLVRSFLNSHPDALLYNEIFHATKERRALRHPEPASIILDGADPEPYLHECIFPPQSRNHSVIGFKLFPSHAASLGWEDLWQWAMRDPLLSIVHVERRNVLDIVLSMSIALRDRKWHTTENQPPAHSICIPWREFAWRMQSTSDTQERIRADLRQKPHVTVFYEALQANPRSALAPVLAHLGLPDSLLWNNEGLQKMASQQRRIALENYDELHKLCTAEHPEWLRFFDEPEPQSQSPSKITFYLQLYHDGDLARHTLRRLRQHYPDARVILLSDGDDNHTYHSLAAAFNAEYIRGERLYGKENGGKMLQRMFDEFLKGHGDVLVKIDTDTRIDRPFRQPPTDNAVYGTPLRLGPPQGGCVLFPRDVAARLAASGVLLSPELLDPHTSWGKCQYPSFLEEHLKHTGRMSFEWTLYWACQKIGITVKPYDDVYSTWKQGIVNSDRKFAAVHPDKFLHIDNDSIHDACIGAHSKLSTIYLDALYRSR